MDGSLIEIPMRIPWEILAEYFSSRKVDQTDSQ